MKPQTLQGINFDSENIWHVLPVNDIKKHIESGFECECGPKVQIQENGGVIVTHKSFDKREYFEKGSFPGGNPNHKTITG